MAKYFYPFGRRHIPWRCQGVNGCQLGKGKALSPFIGGENLKCRHLYFKP